MPRTLMQFGIAKLEEIFASSKDDAVLLTALDEELQYRHVPRAVALHAKVQRALSKAKAQATPNSDAVSPVPEVAVPQDRQPDLWGEQADSVPPVAPARAVARPTPHPVAPQAAVQPSVPESLVALESATPLDMSVNNAYRILKATSASTWEEIEETRRQLVQEAHPQRVARLSPERRAQARVEANRINTAYAVLLAHLIGNV